MIKPNNLSLSKWQHKNLHYIDIAVQMIILYKLMIDTLVFESYTDIMNLHQLANSTIFSLWLHYLTVRIITINYM